METRTHVEDVMTESVVACRPDDTLDRAARIMWEHDCGCVPVIDAHGSPIAMITDRDACIASYTQGKPLSAMSVASAMSGRVVTVRIGETIAAAERLMRHHRVRRVPVVDGHGRLAGVLSFADIVAHGNIGPNLGDDGLRVDAIAETLAVICQRAQTPGAVLSRMTRTSRSA